MAILLLLIVLVILIVWKISIHLFIYKVVRITLGIHCYTFIEYSLDFFPLLSISPLEHSSHFLPQICN